MNMSISDIAMFRFNLWQKNAFFSHHAAAVAAAHAGAPGMENSQFVPNPLTSPALMVLASTAAESRDGARMPAPPRQFQGNQNEKEISTPFTAPPFTMYRPGEPFPPALYAPVPPFARGGMERGMGMMNAPGSSAFRPVSSEENFHSAFSLAKKPKYSEEARSSYTPSSKSEQDGGESSNHEDLDLNKDGPISLVKEERPSSLSSVTNSETFSECGDLDGTSSDLEGRSLRKQRRKCVLDGQTPCCPICGITLRVGEVEAHYALELDKLHRYVRGGRKSRDTTPQGRKTLPSPSTSKRGKDSPSIEAAALSRFDTYMRIKCNRQTRLASRSKNRKKKTEETQCPVCCERLSGTPEELNCHVEICLKKKNNLNCEDEPVDIEGDGESYEEYTWAGQTRIRSTTLLEGGFSGSGFQTGCKKGDEDMDISVDADDSEQYGKPQYTEGDIIPCSLEEPEEDQERRALRGAVLRNISPVEGCFAPEPSTSYQGEVTEDLTDQSDEGVTSTDGNSSPEKLGLGGSSAAEVIAALKMKLREKEDNSCSTRTKCLICMEPYTKPLTSIQCWHVHCENCWLNTLGAKKLCPQCNMITSPGDLRRIYL